MAKYVVHPGSVISKEDQQRHYIGAYQLMHLYKVSPKDCYIFRPHVRYPDDAIHLYPKADGDYRLEPE